MKLVILTVLRFYKSVLSPIFLPILGNGCRFTPTCSEYSIDVISKYGIVKGIRLSFIRLSKCHSL
jgi:putative membrane protein insertion efficiency factor